MLAILKVAMCVPVLGEMCYPTAMTDSKEHQRRKDLLIFGNYFEVDGERVDPLRVSWETVHQPSSKYSSLVADINAARLRAIVESKAKLTKPL